MADISALSRLIGGLQRQISLSSNTLVLDNVKIKMGSGNDANHATFSGSLTAARTITMPDANVDLSDIATNTAHSSGDGSDHQDVADLVTLSGSAANSTNHGAFTGSTLSDTETTRSALQALETAHEETDANADDLITLSGVAENATDLGTFTGTTIPDSSTNKGALQALETAHEETDTNADDLVTLSGVAENSTDLGTFTGTTIPDSSTIKSALQSLETKAENNTSLINNFEWQESALDYITDNTVAPPTEVSGDRYVLSHDGGAPHANWDGASAGDIVEFNGTTWDAVTPTTGTFIAVDDDSSGVYQWGGSSWSFKNFEATTASTGLTKVGFDIRLADAAENASGIQVSGGAITLNDLGAFSTTDLAEGTNLYHTTARARTAAVDDTAYAGSWDAVTDQAPSKNAVYDKIESLSTADTTHTQADTGDWTVGDGSSTAAHLDELADRTAALEADSSTNSLDQTIPAGETITAGIRAVRWGITGDAETAGRVYLAEKTPATNDGSDDLFHVVGLVVGLAVEDLLVMLLCCDCVVLMLVLVVVILAAAAGCFPCMLWLGFCC